MLGLHEAQSLHQRFIEIHTSDFTPLPHHAIESSPLGESIHPINLLIKIGLILSEWLQQNAPPDNWGQQGSFSLSKGLFSTVKQRVNTTPTVFVKSSFQWDPRRVSRLIHGT